MDEGNDMRVVDSTTKCNAVVQIWHKFVFGGIKVQKFSWAEVDFGLHKGYVLGG